MWKCERCGEIFDEPGEKKVCYEDYYGVSSLFTTNTYGYFAVCPNCGSDYIDEWFRPEYKALKGVLTDVKDYARKGRTPFKKLSENKGQ